MDLRQMRYILKVAECGSITKAAAALYLAQPSLSNYIAKAERELGVVLFDRSASPLRLTFAGEEYVKDAKQILLMQERLEKKLADISNVVRERIRVGISYERGSFMLSEIIPAFKQRFPDTEVEITAGGRRKLDGLLDDGLLDFIIFPAQVQEPNRKYVTIYQEELLLCAKPGVVQKRHLLPGSFDTIDLLRCSDLPLIRIESGRAISDAFDSLFSPSRRKVNIVYTAYSVSGALRMAANGFGVCIVPNMTLDLTRYAPETQVYSLGQPPVYWDVCAIARKDAYLGVAEQAFIDIAVQAFQSYTDRLQKRIRQSS